MEKPKAKQEAHQNEEDTEDEERVDTHAKPAKSVSKAHDSKHASIRHCLLSTAVRDNRCSTVQEFEETKPSRSSKAVKKDEVSEAASIPLPEEEESTGEQETHVDKGNTDVKPAKKASQPHAHEAQQAAHEDGETEEGAEPAEGYAKRLASKVQSLPCMHSRPVWPAQSNHNKACQSQQLNTHELPQGAHDWSGLGSPHLLLVQSACLGYRCIQ